MGAGPRNYPHLSPTKPKALLPGAWPLWVCLGALTSACATSGSVWMSERWDGTGDAWSGDSPPEIPDFPREGQRQYRELRSHTLGKPRMHPGPETASGMGPRIAIRSEGKARGARRPTARLDGRVLGTFRNTYYDFPSERDFHGNAVTIFDAQCKALDNVPRPFFEHLCVQGSGLLSSGATVSFNRRGCECAETCPRTGEKICFDRLDISKYPWGRGATGRAITPLWTVAVDPSIIALGTVMYIPEYEGLPRDLEHHSRHDGCFLAEDRGKNVLGRQIDVFTGQSVITDLWNSLVPSNQGVTVVVDSPKCPSAKPTTPEPE